MVPCTTSGSSLFSSTAEGGAVGVAALLAGKFKPKTPTAILLTGGNVDPALFQKLVA